mmetsp:Transcript_10464/g.23120  ORF Transcript_10464/g.23120 Transcript_10464/m.23120 type:complete len:221 (-) Transcript_10464:414-1076(-)
MKFPIVVTLFFSHVTYAFLISHDGPSSPAFCTSPRAPLSTSPSLLLAAYDLAPEPPGGTEIPVPDAASISRVKDLGRNDAKSSAIGADVHDFWMTSSAEAKSIKENWTSISKDAAKNAAFPGFRKGQIPPYAQPKMVAFAIQESVITACSDTVEQFGLKGLEEDGEVDVKEDVKEICKGYNIKKPEDVVFTATFSATYIEGKDIEGAGVDDESVIDATVL